MKRFDLPLWSDALCLFLCLFPFCLAVFRFSLPLWAALCLALAAAGAAAALLFLFLRARRIKRHQTERERTAARGLAFHMAMSPPEQNAALLARCLNAACTAKTPPAADDPSETPSEPPSAEQTAEAPPETPPTAPASAAPEAPSAPYTAERDRILSERENGYVRFRFEKVTADELSPILCGGAAGKTVYANAFTDEAKTLAASFGLRLVEGEEVYALVKESGCMPKELIAPPKHKGGLRQFLQAHLRRRAWRGYAFAGCSLLLFSVLTVFPVYYIVSGSLLLALSLFLRFFGKKE